MRHILSCLLILTLIIVTPHSAGAQSDPASLVADRVSIRRDAALVAEGNVEVFFQGQSLRATRIIYDRSTDRLLIEGPIVLNDGTGSFIVADQADLSADLTEGVLTSARLVLNQQLQLASTELRRVGGRYTELKSVVASSCQVCASNPTPLWEIRASRVVHDQQERQIFFDNAQFRVGGVPVFYLPRLRMPDPTLKRTAGFLVPRIRTTSGLGTGLKLPYFVTLGPSRDLTVTPYISTKRGRTVELRYRQAFRTGDIELNGALSRDELVPGKTRGYLTAAGNFDLPQNFKLLFRGEVVSDDAYLLDYGLGDKDRLDSRIEITRTRRNEYISGRLIAFKSIRAGENNATLPSIITDMTFHRRFALGEFGGEGGLRFQTHSAYRSSASPLDGNGDGIADGRDLGRASVRLDWSKNWVLPGGVLGAVLGEVTADYYSVRQDAAFGGGSSRLHGAVAMELRWPWVKAGANGATHVIEPMVQLVLSPSGTETLPNEDSALVEFDEANLFALNRFPGSDAVERGARANIGVSWTRIDPAGWTVGVTLGRVVRTDDLGQFSAASGLDGSTSDWLAAVQIALPDGVLMTNRVLFDDNTALTKAEMRLDVNRARYGLSTGYLWVVADPAENRPDPISELVVDGRYNLTDAWVAKVATRYDFQADRATSAGLGLAFRNECVLVDLSLSRRFTSSTSVRPTTDFGLSVDLLGFGSGVQAGPARQCRR